MSGKRNSHVLIVVQNLPVPLDRRVWLECLALKAAGYDVSVICPKSPGDARRQSIDGVHIYKYRPAPNSGGLRGYVVEFAYSWLRTTLLSVAVWRRQPFQVLQACNPPDTYWLLARLWGTRGVRFVFDQHDLNPELFLSRFGMPSGLGQRAELAALRWLEQMTYRAADRVISTNESYRAVALDRGQRRRDEVTVVRSGPNTHAMRPVHPAKGTPAVRGFQLVYLGIMGPQDNVGVVLEVMEKLVHERGRTDVHAHLLGFGDCLEQLRDRCRQLGLDPYVTFTGRADRDMVADHLSAADVGLCPDLKTPLNDVSTMNKTMEYMSYALPSVSFDLRETRVSAGEGTVLFVESGDVTGFVDEVEKLLDDADLRRDMGLRARARVASELDWRAQSRAYVGVFDDLVGVVRARAHVDDKPDATQDHRGRHYVADQDMAWFVVERSRQAPGTAGLGASPVLAAQKPIIPEQTVPRTPPRAPQARAVRLRGLGALAPLTRLLLVTRTQVDKPSELPTETVSDGH
jgi:glycosyltransferase involved in cell wall biosynthesis